MDQLAFTTRQAARCLGCEPHVLQSNYRRRGSYLGIVPRKGRGGRLVWSADAVRRAALPTQGQEPNGLDAWLDWVNVVAPETPATAAHSLGLALLGSEATPGWRPAPRQLGVSRLDAEAAVLGLAVRALVERFDQASVLAGTSVGVCSLEWLARTVRGALRYVPSAEGAA